MALMRELRVTDQAKPKSACSATEASQNIKIHMEQVGLQHFTDSE